MKRKAIIKTRGERFGRWEEDERSNRNCVGEFQPGWLDGASCGISFEKLLFSKLLFRL